jgi:anti-sigma regulatory factor (Ser/Thr protein kinase)
VLSAHVVLPGISSSVPTARHFVESLLTAWGSQDLGWTAALVVSELAANCTLHARTEFTVRVLQEGGGGVRLEVTDGSARVPQQRGYGIEATTGRGLLLVQQLSEQWGVDSTPYGKTVWVRLGPAPEAGEDEVALLSAYADDDPA